ncbi:MAG: F0F1 ATP synthase subunit epsilon [Alphaproteobacteria bacterium]|nr:F0F1 ATP synthase subunit epsilon [Alphaproteobacteria bacterium]
MTPLTVEIRTPSGVVLQAPALAVSAEDRTGWFGIRPGRTDLVAVLPPGLLVVRDQEGETFVALSGGLLSLESGHCRVITTEASVSRDLDTVATEVARQHRRRQERAEVHHAVVRDLAREALRRILAGRETA